MLFRLLFPNSFIRDINSKPKIFTKTSLQKMQLHCYGWFLDGEIILEVRRLNLSFAEIPTTFNEIEWRGSFINIKAVIEMIYSLLLFRIKYWIKNNFSFKLIVFNYCFFCRKVIFLFIILFLVYFINFQTVEIL